MKRILTLLAIASSLILSAQDSPTLYPMANIFQNQFNNPAYEPYSKVSLNLASASINTGFTGFPLGQFIVFDSTETQSDVTFGELIDDLGENNKFIFKNSITFFGLGFKVKNMYFQISGRSVTSVNFNLPKDLVLFMYEGNGETFLNRPADFSSLNLNLSSYVEAGIAVSLPVGDRLRVGARAKYLSGLANITTDDFNLTYTTDNENYGAHIRGSYALKTSNLDIQNPESAVDDILNAAQNGEFLNTGFALDLGATLKFSDRLTFSGALNDLGFINWTNKAKVYENDNLQFDYEGEDLYSYVTGEESEEGVQERIVDSLINAITFNEKNESYTSSIPASILLGAEFKLANGNFIGAVANADYVPGIFIPTFTGYYRLQLGKIMGLSISNAIAYRSVLNPGAAFSLKLGPLQVFASSDNLLGLVNIDKTKSASVAFGVNLVFGGDGPLKDLVAPE